MPLGGRDLDARLVPVPGEEYRVTRGITLRPADTLTDLFPREQTSGLSPEMRVRWTPVTKGDGL